MKDTDNMRLTIHSDHPFFRATQKEAKAEKKAGIKKVSAEAAASKLLAACDGSLQDAVVCAWLAAKTNTDTEAGEGSAHTLCTAHMRAFGGCELKRCRQQHAAVTVGHLRALEPTLDEDLEVPLEPMVSLRAVRPVDYPRMRYISVDGRCVFDWAHVGQWRNYSAEMDAQRSSLKVCDSVAGMAISRHVASIEEEGEEEGAEVDEEHRTSTGKVPRILAAVARQQEVLVSLSAALPLLDLLHLGEACSELRRAMQSAPELRRRLKEARSAATAGLARKRIKAEQKKQRNAHKPSNDRVDAYSRGCCGK